MYNESITWKICCTFTFDCFCLLLCFSFLFSFYIVARPEVSKLCGEQLFSLLALLRSVQSVLNAHAFYELSHSRCKLGRLIFLYSEKRKKAMDLNSLLGIIWKLFGTKAPRWQSCQEFNAVGSIRYKQDINNPRLWGGVRERLTVALPHRNVLWNPICQPRSIVFINDQEPLLLSQHTS